MCTCLCLFIMVFDQCSQVCEMGQGFGGWCLSHSLSLVRYFFIKVLLENYGLIKYYHAGTLDTSEQVKAIVVNREAQSFSCSHWTRSVCPTCLSLFTFWLALCDNCDLFSLLFNLLIDCFGNIN